MTNEICTDCAVAYTKIQLLRSERYAARRDLLNVLLVDNESYTLAQVDELIENRLKRRVR